MTLPEPLVLRVMPGRMRGPGRGAVWLGGALIGLGLIPALIADRTHWLLVLAVVLGLLLAGLGVMNLMIARSRPVALRIDRHGVSGYYVPPLAWAEISRIDRTAPGANTLGIALQDRDEVRRRQRSPWTRFNLSLPLQGGWHLLVPGEVLEADLDEVVRVARAFQAAD